MFDYNKISMGIQNPNSSAADTSAKIEPPVEDPAEKYIVANTDKVNIRESASKDSDVVCVANKDDELLVVDICDGWARVYNSSGLAGYVMQEYIEAKVV